MKVSFDVEELKRSILASATTAKNQLSEMAKQAHLQERLDEAIKLVKSSELMKNPQVAKLMKSPQVTKLTQRLSEVPEQLEKVVAEVKTRVNEVANNWNPAKKKGAGPKKKAHKKDSEKAH